MDIILSLRAELMLKYAVKHDTGLEVGGFGRTSFTDKGDIYVDDILIPPQEVQPAHTAIEVEHLEWLLARLAERGENMDDWRLWWHSHCNMGVTPSGTDLTTLDELARDAWDSYAVGMVVNSRDERYSWVSVAKPLVLKQELKVVTQGYVDEEVKAEVTEMMGLVKRKAYTPPQSNWQRNAGNGGGGSGSSQAAASATAGDPNRKRIRDMTEEEFIAWVNDELDNDKKVVTELANAGSDAERQAALVAMGYDGYWDV